MAVDPTCSCFSWVRQWKALIFHLYLTFIPVLRDSVCVSVRSWLCDGVVLHPGGKRSLPHDILFSVTHYSRYQWTFAGSAAAASTEPGVQCTWWFKTRNWQLFFNYFYSLVQMNCALTLSMSFWTLKGIQGPQRQMSSSLSIWLFFLTHCSGNHKHDYWWYWSFLLWLLAV